MSIVFNPSRDPSKPSTDATTRAIDAALTGPGASVLDDCRERITSWLTNPRIPDADRLEISRLVEARGPEAFADLRDRFYRELEFGTGGLRGLTGAGNNRMNAPVVRRAIQGLSNYILKQGEGAVRRGVAIAYDSRLRSREFALEAARVLAANGIRSYVFDTVQTTPCLSFAVRKLGCVSGLCLTASHNPPQYHGLKVYWDDGAQIIPPQDEGILEEVFRLQGWEEAKSVTESEARAAGLLGPVPASVVDAYFEALDSLRIYGPAEATRDVGIVYTPLHGTGAEPTRRALTRWGFERLSIVPEQEEPDGRFPTVKKPNPEEIEALALAIDLATRTNADLAVATDPDSDRLALVVRDPRAAKGLFASQSQGDYVFLNGNQTGALLIDHILRGLSAKGRLKPSHAVVKTIVTSELHRLVCRKHGVAAFDTLTGFKWIAGLVREWETKGRGEHEYLFGTEESFGYMPGTYVRDKDGIGALCQAIEMVAFLKSNGRTAVDRLLELFAEHGAWAEDLINFDLVGEKGALRIRRVMEAFRSRPPESLSGTAVARVRDYKLRSVQARIGKAFAETAEEKILLPVSDVLQYELEDGSRISMRPSGTEPKLKIYVSVCTRAADPAKGHEASLARLAGLRKELSSLIDAIP